MTSPMRLPVRNARGFGLVELMIVVGIIGILAAVAIPEFRKMGLRSKRSEREVMMSALMRTVNDHWREHGRLPGGAAPELPSNPPYPPDGSRQPFSEDLPGWKALGWRPDGHLHYRYELSGTVDGNAGTLSLRALADLDQDGELSIKTVTYTLQDGMWQRTGEEESGDDF